LRRSIRIEVKTGGGVRKGNEREDIGKENEEEIKRPEIEDKKRLSGGREGA